MAELSGKLAEQMYAQAGDANAAAGAADAAADEATKKPEEGVVDAEFEEVKDK